MVEHKPREEAHEPNEPRSLTRHGGRRRRSLRDPPAKREVTSQGSARADSRVPCGTAANGDFGRETNAPDIERFFCIYCGYDLTGHSGDERRCPECGNVTTTKLLQAALLVQRRSIRLLESATIPSLLFWAVAFTGAASIGTRSMWLYFICAMSVSAWAWSIVLYLDRYDHHYDCWWFLLESHIVRLVLPVAALVLIVSGLLLVMAGPRWQVVAVPVISAITLAIAWIGYRDLKRRLPAYKLPKPPETNSDG